MEGEQLKKIAAAAKMTPDEFKKRFSVAV